MYCRIKFTSAGNSFNTSTFTAGAVTASIAQWIARVLSGTTLPSALPPAVFDINNCSITGSLPAGITVTGQGISGTSAGNYVQFTKQHSQNSNFVSLFRIYQSNLNAGYAHGIPRMLSSNSTNEVPAGAATSSYWFNAGTESNYMSATLANVEYQFFISAHWVIWSVLNASGQGGTAGLFDVESTGSDVWARTLNSLYSPQILISCHGNSWPSSATLQTTETAARNQGIYHLLAYNGDTLFNSKSYLQASSHAIAASSELPQLYPNISNAFFSTRDSIGDTQNYMIPVYYFTGAPISTTTGSSRAVLNGRIPYLWRTTDNAGQTGQTATVSGVEYRFVRLHNVGSGTTGVNAGTYMVPTTIGGI